MGCVRRGTTVLPIYLLTMSAQLQIREIPSATSVRPLPPFLVLVTWLCLMSLAAAAILALRGPAPVTATAPLQDFSAERALAHVRAIARAPHPTGSSENKLAAQYLLAQLSALGLQSQVFETVGVHS